MKTFLMSAVYVLVLTLPVTAQRHFKINGKMGMSMPMEFSTSAFNVAGFGDDHAISRYQPGVGAELSFGYMIRPNIEVGIGGASYRALAKNTGGSLKQFTFQGFGTYYFLYDNFRPYIRGGAGLTKLGFDLQTQFHTYNDVNLTMPSIGLAGGAEINLSDETIINFSGGMNYLFSKNKNLAASGGFRAAWLGNFASSTNSYKFDKNLTTFYFSAGLMFGLRL
ncbi:outer membrane beta-barrel protein [bacterium]|nr:outer membrane beta-barrel protein [bacterium]